MLTVRVGADAAMVLASRVGGAAANLAAVLILSRHLPQVAVGQVLTALACALVADLLASLGREGVAIRVLPQAAPPVASAYLRGTARLMAYAVPLAVLGAALAAWALTGEAALAILAGLIVPPAATLRVVSRMVHATGRIAESAVLFNLARPLLFAASLLLLSACGTLSPAAALGAALAAAIVAAGIQCLRARGPLAARAAPPGDADPGWTRSGAALLLTSLLLGDLAALVTVVAATLLSADDVAVLGVSLRIAALLTLGSGALIAALGPRLSRAWGRGERASALGLARAIPRVSVPLVGAGVVTVWLAAPMLLSVFGPAYADDGAALRLLVLMPLATAAAGPNLLVMVTAGHAQAAGGVAARTLPLVALGTLAGSLLGPVGAAAGVVFGHAVWEVMLLRALWRAEGASLWLPFGPRR